MFIGLHIKYTLFLSDFNENLIFSTDFQKTLSIKYHENPSSGNQTVPCRWTDGDMTKLTVAFRNFLKCLKMRKIN